MDFPTEKRGRSTHNLRQNNGEKHTLYEIHKGIVSKETLRDRTLREAIDLYSKDMLPLGSAADVERHLK